jgi:hypothetical protein
MGGSGFTLMTCISIPTARRSGALGAFRRAWTQADNPPRVYEPFARRRWPWGGRSSRRHFSSVSRQTFRGFTAIAHLFGSRAAAARASSAARRRR